MAQSHENTILNLIRVADKTSPEMVRAIQLLLEDLYKVYDDVFPETPPLPGEFGGPAKILGAVQNFTATAYPDNLRLDWDNLPGAFRYQIKQGNDWETAKPIVVTATDVANVDPVFLNLIYGTYNFFISAWNIDGVPGEIISTSLTIPQIGPPDLTLEVVVSTVLLRWTVPASSWRINHFIIYKDGLEIGRVFGTFKLIQEQVGGSYSYSVRAVDIVGNESTMSATKTADLHDPSEFEFVDELSADYTGTYVRTDFARIDSIPGIIGPVHIHTWTEHFEFFNFDSPQHQVDSGYPIYYQPSYLGQGTYEEIFDFGEIYKAITIVVDYNQLQINGSTNISTELSYSDDGINWSTPVIGISTLALSFRYVKVIWAFENADDKSVAFISNLKVVLNVTLTLDSGSVDCLAAHAGGTLVTYNKDFTGISSVTATATVSLQPLYAVCDAVTKDNFRILIFDSSGNRESANVSWKARGVV